MGLESATFISQLVASNPVGGVDDYATADDHLRLIKAVLKGQFPNFTAAAMNASVVELNLLVGLTATAAELNKLDGFTGLPADLNVLSGADAGGLTAAELLFVKDVTSAIQVQINGKAPTAHSHDTAEIANNAITLPKLLDIATASFLGRLTAATGDPEVLTAANARTILGVEAGATADQTAAQIEAIVSHDNLLAFLGAEHVDWAVTGAENIHADRLLSIREQYFVKTANESRTSDTVLADDTHFVGMALTTGKRYAIEGCFQGSGDPGDLDFKFVFTNSPVAALISFIRTEPAGTTDAGNTAMLVEQRIVFGGGAVTQMIHWTGKFQANAITGGTFKLQWAQGVSDATPTTLTAGSWLRITELD